MGEWMKARNVKWGNETELARFLVQRTFGCENRSQTVRTALHLVRDIITAGMLPDVLQGLQESHCAHEAMCAHGEDSAASVRMVPVVPIRRRYRYAWHGLAASSREAFEFMGMLARECSRQGAALEVAR